MALFTEEHTERPSAVPALEHDSKPKKKNELTILTESVFTQKSPATAELVEKLQTSQPDLSALLLDTLKEKGELDKENVEWIDESTVKLTNVSNVAIHSFVLKAESYANDVTYTKQSIIKISK